MKQDVEENSIIIMKDYYSNEIMLNPILLAHAIVEAIATIGRGKEMTIQLFPRSILSLIFTSNEKLQYKRFFDRVKYELELYMHFSLIPKDIKLKILELLCITDETVKDKEKLLMLGIMKNNALFCKSMLLKNCEVAKTEQSSNTKVIRIVNMESKSFFELQQESNKQPVKQFPDKIFPSQILPIPLHSSKLPFSSNSKPPFSSKAKPMQPSVKSNPEFSSREGKNASELKLQVGKKDMITKPAFVADPMRPSRSRPVRKVHYGNSSGQKTANQLVDQEKGKNSATVNQNEVPLKEQDAAFKEPKKCVVKEEEKGRPRRELKTVPCQMENIHDYVLENDIIQEPTIPVNAAQPSEELTKIKEEAKPFKLTLKLLRKNVTFKSNGHVKLKEKCSEDFKKYVEEEVREGSLPFKLDSEDLLPFISKWAKKAPTQKCNEREYWRPKLHSPIKIYANVKKEDFKTLRQYVYQLTEEQVARLQSLIYCSNLAPTDSGKYISREISKRTLKFLISPEHAKYQIERGWIQIPSYPENLKQFSDAIASLTDSQVTVTSVPLTLSITVSLKKRNLSKENEEVLLDTGLPADCIASTTEDLKKDNGIEVLEITNSNELNVIGKRVDGEKAPLPSSDMKADVFPNGSDFSQLVASSDDNGATNISEKVSNNNSSMELKATSTPFVPMRKRLSLSGFIRNFTKIRFEVTPDNYKAMLARFSQLIQSGVEYVALDCEMTGLYTREDEAEHCRDPSQVPLDNTKKLMKAVDKNLMFQLGLTVKTLDGQFSGWSFFTAPKLTKESFTPETFKFLFLKPRGINESFGVDLPAILHKINHFANHSVAVAPFLSWIFFLRIPIVLFSNYVDLMHVLKASNREYNYTHEEVQKQLECNFFDIKLIAKACLKASFSLELLLQKLYPGLTLDKNQLHDASYDSLLTALAFEKLKRIYGKEHMIARVLFNYEFEYGKPKI